MRLEFAMRRLQTNHRNASSRASGTDVQKRMGGFDMTAKGSDGSRGPHANRREVLKGAAGLAALTAAGALAPISGSAQAQTGFRTQLLQFPGVGKGSPTDADWQKVGEMCLGP